jgi:membrane associated rhomboid family serine protease
MLPLRDRIPTRRVPIVNYAIVAANVGAFLWERSLLVEDGDPREILAWAVVPARLWTDPPHQAFTVLSSMFLHDPSGWAHLVGNMLFLWIFGDNVEDALGSGRYIGFYLLAGISAAGAQILSAPYSAVPMLGASGAISGVLAAYGSLYPRSPITVLNPVLPLWLFFGPFFELPAWFVIGEYFVVNLMSVLLTPATGGGVAFVAHIGGFLAGLILVRFFMVGRVPAHHERWQRQRMQRRPRDGSGDRPWWQ